MSTAISRQIGDVKTRETKDNVEHEIQYFVLDADMEEYFVPVGTAADWAPSDESLTVMDRSREMLAPGAWIVTLTARTPSGGGGGGVVSDNLGDQYERRYTVGEMYFLPEWYGVHKASKLESGWCDSAGNSATVREPSNAHQNIDAGRAVENDWIFDNSSRLLPGTANYAKSPFLSSPALPIKGIGQKTSTIIYNVAFHLQKNMNAVCTTHFYGVNPSGGFSKFLMPFDSTAGKWRLVDQTLVELHDKKGKIWTRIERKLEYAPLGLQFDPGKNGGIWSWS
jgi:hypothetical protein